VNGARATAGELGRLADRTILAGFGGVRPPAWLRRIAPGLAGVVLYGQNLPADPAAATLAATLRTDGDVLVAVDEEGGDVTRLHYRGGSPDPGNQVLGAAGDPAGTAGVAAGIGARLRAAGILLDLAPVVDVNANPDNPVIGVRSFGADPDLVAAHGAAWITGLQSQGVAGCAKHFPGHGDTATDSHLALPTVDCDEATWRRVHLPPFVAAIAAGVRAVMTAHLRVPALDARVATLSRPILTGLLRTELGFDGVVVTDALDMAAVAADPGVPAAAVAALGAGADALCLGGRGGQAGYRRVRAAIVAAVRAGELPVARLAQAAARVDALHAWTAAAVPRTVPVPAGDPGLDLTRRAARYHRVTPLAGPPVLLELRGDTNLAVGAATWDLGTPLGELGYRPAGAVRLTGVAAVPAALATAAGHPVVLVGRDVPRHRWQYDVWRAVLAARPDAVLVDLGLPRPDALAGGRYVLVGGAARPNLRVAAELLAGVPPAGAGRAA